MYLTNLYPKPVSIQENQTHRYTFADTETLYINHAISSAVAERMKYLWHRFCCTASTLTIAVCEKDAPGFTAWLGQHNCPTALPEHYTIDVTDAGVLLSAANEKALLDSFTTLVQLICPVSLDVGEEAFYITTAHIEDKPAIAFRSVHLCIFPDSACSLIEKAIHMAGFLKFTHVVLEFWGTIAYTVCPELGWQGKAWDKAKVREVVSLVQSYGMEVIPMFNHIGHATASRSMAGRHVALNRNLRLAKYFEPDGWTWCSSSQKTRNLLAEIRGELMELCGCGSYFHIGADEAYSFGTCDVCRNKVPHELLAETINDITADLCRHGRRPIMWHDQLLERERFAGFTNPVVASQSAKNTAAAIDLLDKRILIADWQYDYTAPDSPTAPYFAEKGFDTILCPWDAPKNFSALCSHAKRYGSYGVMITTWHHLQSFLPKFPTAAACAWEKDTPPLGVHHTEVAALLRYLYDAAGNFALSGWYDDERTE